MGIYLNPENDEFWRAVRSKIYVYSKKLNIAKRRYAKYNLF